MCGIVGYAGEKEAFPILLNGLKKLEYRGYDSAGIAIFNHEIKVFKQCGKVADLEKSCSGGIPSGSLGIGHTRWATHGEPNDTNAHPHTSASGLFSIVHNGIVENYPVLKDDLEKNGFTMRSDTDTEVLANLIEYFYLQDDSIDAETGIRMALSKVVGAYGIAVLCRDEPGRLFAAKKGSPLVVGLGRGEYLLGSDASPIVEYTDHVIYLNDNDLAIIQKDNFTLRNLENNPASITIRKPDVSIGDISKGSFEHYMLKEIFEQPSTIEETFRGRLRPDTPEIFIGGLHDVFPDIASASRIIILGCGTSWHAGLIGKYLIEEYAGIPVEVEYASEFRYRKPVLQERDVVIAISQSGETADTLAAVRMARESQVLVTAICNVAGSGIARETKAGVFTHAGTEIGVASTKAFTAQVTVLTLLALKLASTRGMIAPELYLELVQQLATIPDKVRLVLAGNDKIRKVAEKYAGSVNALYLGRGILFPVALEGALKLKEISYIHAEGYPAGEMKHGPIALVDNNLPVVVVALRDAYYEKLISNIREVKARNGNIIAVISDGDTHLKELADDVFEIPVVHPALAPLLSVIPLQLFAYHVAILRGCNVDQPRNLAKSVTVE